MSFSLSEQLKTLSNNSSWGSSQSYFGCTPVLLPATSSKKQEYIQFFRDVLPLVDRFRNEDITEQSLRRHKIKLLDAQSPFFGDMINDGSIYVEPSKTKLNGLETVFDVLIGKFYLVVHVLHIFRNSTEKKDEKKDEKYVGSGTFGTVKLINVKGKQIALKRLNFPEGRIKPITIPRLLDPNDICFPEEIRKAVKEYCIYKICSLLKIGPQVIFTDVYDLVCYNDGIEFQMELCEPVEFKVKRTYAQDLKYCVAKLHDYKFAHNDIKPENTLFSPSLKRYVLSDFGLSQSIKQGLGEATKTYFKGTMKYASPEMRALHSNQIGQVDLFYHDMHSLKVCIQQYEQYVQDESESSSESSFQEPNSSCRKSISEIYREESQTPGCSRESGIGSEASRSLDQHPETTTTQSSSFYQPSVLFKQFVLNSVEINFYIMKTLYGVFKEDEASEVENRVGNKEKIEKMIDETARRVCGEGYSQQLLVIVIELVNAMVISPDQKNNNIIASTRSTLRIYGFYSDQFIGKLKDIQKSNSLQFLPSKQLEGRIRYLQKFTQNNSAKKFERVCQNLLKHQRLGNQKTYLESIKFILKFKNCSENLNSDLKKAILKGCLYFIGEIQQGDIPAIYAIFQPDIEPSINQTLSLGSQKLHQNDKYYLVEYLEKVAKIASFYNCMMAKYFFDAYLHLGAPQSAQAILNQIVKMHGQITNNQLKEPHLLQGCKDFSVVYLKSVLSLMLCLSKVDSRQCCAFILKILQKTKKTSLSYEKIGTLLFSAKILANEPQFLEIAQELNQLSYELRKQFYFPVVDFEGAIEYFCLKGIISKKRGQFAKALEYFHSSTVALSDQLSITSSYGRVERIYSELYLTYEAVGDYLSAMRYFEHMVKLNFENPECAVQKKLRFLGNFIRYKIKLNHTADLYNLFDSFFQLKMLLATESHRSEDCPPSLRRITGFILPEEQASTPIKKQTLLSAKIALVQVLSKYLPIFLTQYRRQCEWVARYNIEILHMKSRALPYLWNYFRKFPCYQIPQDQNFFEKLYMFANMLIESNSNRIAFKFLEKYAYKIPNQSSKFTQLIFKKLYALSRDLGHRKFKVYHLICRHRPYQSKANYQFCLQQINRISEFQMKHPLKKAVLKKIASFQPGFRCQSTQKIVTPELQMVQQENCLKKIWNESSGQNLNNYPTIK